jgi:hypothetical protein
MISRRLSKLCEQKRLIQSSMRHLAKNPKANVVILGEWASKARHKSVPHSGRSLSRNVVRSQRICAALSRWPPRPATRQVPIGYIR